MPLSAYRIPPTSPTPYSSHACYHPRLDSPTTYPSHALVTLLPFDLPFDSSHALHPLALQLAHQGGEQSV